MGYAGCSTGSGSGSSVVKWWYMACYLPSVSSPFWMTRRHRGRGWHTALPPRSFLSPPSLEQWAPKRFAWCSNNTSRATLRSGRVCEGGLLIRAVDTAALFTDSFTHLGLICINVNATVRRGHEAISGYLCPKLPRIHIQFLCNANVKYYVWKKVFVRLKRCNSWVENWTSFSSIMINFEFFLACTNVAVVWQVKSLQTSSVWLSK